RPRARGSERPVVLRAPSFFWLYARTGGSGAVAHAVHRKPQPNRPRGAGLASRRHSQRLGHDGLDRDQDAVRGSAFALITSRRKLTFAEQRSMDALRLRGGLILCRI